MRSCGAIAWDRCDEEHHALCIDLFLPLQDSNCDERIDYTTVESVSCYINDWLAVVDIAAAFVRYSQQRKAWTLFKVQIFAIATAV